MTMTVTVDELEEQIWHKEGIRVVIRAPAGTLVQPYKWIRQTRGTWTVARWFEEKVSTLVPGGAEGVVLGRDAVPVARNTSLTTVRFAYT
jgi:hypothetical protein